MLSSGSTATIWKIDPKEKYSDIQLSTSGKGKDGKYYTDFRGFARCVGEAHAQVRDLVAGKDCKLKVDKFGIKTWTSTTGKGKNQKTVYNYNVVIFSFEPNDKLAKNDFTEMNEIDGMLGEEKPNFFDRPPENKDTSFFD